MDVAAANEERDQLPFAQHHAFIIGINAYERVSPLQTAVDDARRLAEVLSAQQHFHVHPPLLDASGDAIRTLLHTTLAAQVCKDDRVFFYFAGHGIAADGDDGPAGYIVPADADPTDVKTFIAMADLQQALDALPCRHLLLVLDCCFSGAFKWSSQYRAIGTLMPKRIYKERFDRFIEDPAWQVITSAAYDQKALDVVHGIGKATGDRGIAKSDDNIAHSPFARALFEGLAGAADAKGDIEGDGVITATELYSYIRDQVEPQTIEEGQRLRQTPGFFPLKKHDKGEFIFLHPRHRLNLQPIPEHSPYKGLASFDEDDQLLFFGRDRVIDELRAKTESSRLLVVSGASGTGKSSVIKAGLLPRLRAEGHRILPVIRPGVHPLAVLEQALLEAHAAPPADASTQKSILIIDQFEEVITRCTNPDERWQFDARLRRLLDEETNIHRIILTVRADFEPQLGSGALKDYWKQGRCTVPHFSLEELKEVIVLPTVQVVLIFDPPQLVEEIIGEVVQSPGALPLLSYALSELYEAYRKSGRQDRALKKDDYDKLGGVMGALRGKADTLYQELPAPEQNTMRKILLRMVSVEGDLASRRVPMDDVVYSDADERLVNNVVEKLVDARLIVKDQDYIEPAHDALVRTWKTLHEWIRDVGKENLILGTKLNGPANEFAQSKDDGLLWDTNPHLSLLEDELKNPRHWLNAKEVAFVKDSAAKMEGRRRRMTTRYFALMSVLLMGALWLYMEFLHQKELTKREALWEKTSDETRDSRMLDVLGPMYASLRDGKLDKTKDLLVELKKLETEPSAQGAVRSEPNGARHDQTKADKSDSNASIEKTLLAKLRQEADLLRRLSDTSLATHQLEKDGVWKDRGPAADLYAAALSSDGTRVLTTSRDGTVRLWDADSGRRIIDLPGCTLRGEGVLAPQQRPRTYAAELFPAPERGRLVAVACSDGTPDASWGGSRNISVLTIPRDALSLAISPDGNYLVTGARDGTVSVWDVKDVSKGACEGASGKTPPQKTKAGFVLCGQPRFVFRGHRAAVTNIGFSRATQDARHYRFVTASRDNTARGWEFKRAANGSSEQKCRNPWIPRIVQGGKDFVCRGPVLTGHSDWVMSAAFAPDGKRMVTTSNDGTTRVWDLDQWDAPRFFSDAAFDARTKCPLQLIQNRTAHVTSAAFSANGLDVLTAARDGTVQAYDACSGKEKGTPKRLDLKLDRNKFVNRVHFEIADKLAGEIEVDLSESEKDLLGFYQLLPAERNRAAEIALDQLVKKYPGQPYAEVARAVWQLWGEVDDKALIARLSIEGQKGKERDIRELTAPYRARLMADAPDQVLRGHTGLLTSAAFSPDGGRLVTASYDGSAWVWDASKGTRICVLKEKDEKDRSELTRAEFSPDGRYVVTTSYGARVSVWQLKQDPAGGVTDDCSQIKRLAGHKEAVYSAAFSPDGRDVITAARDGTRLFRNWDSDLESQPFPGNGSSEQDSSSHLHYVASAAFSPDGTRVLTASNDRTARIWDRTDASKVVVLGGEAGRDGAAGDCNENTTGHCKPVHMAAFSPDGTRVVTASYDTTARVWNAGSGEQLAVLGHGGKVYSAAFNPKDSRIVATASADGLVRIWDVSISEGKAARRPVQTLNGREGEIFSAAWSSDGLRLVTASGEKTASVWGEKLDRSKFATDLNYRAACSLVTPELACGLPRNDRANQELASTYFWIAKPDEVKAKEPLSKLQQNFANDPAALLAEIAYVEAPLEGRGTAGRTRGSSASGWNDLPRRAVDAAAKLDPESPEGVASLSAAVWVLCLILLWPIWHTWVWYRRQAANGIEASPPASPLRRVGAGILDIGLATSLGLLVGGLSALLAKVGAAAGVLYFDYGASQIRSDVLAFQIGVVIFACFVAGYLMLRDATRYRYWLSFGKRILRLRPVTAAGDGAVTVLQSVLHNGFVVLLYLLALLPCALLIWNGLPPAVWQDSPPTELQEVTRLLLVGFREKVSAVGFAGTVLVLTVVGIVELVLSATQRGPLHDRLAGTRVIDVSRKKRAAVRDGVAPSGAGPATSGAVG